MLDNLKLVLVQHKRFLVIFFVAIFLPSVILAFFGIRAIQNERYKLQQQTLEQQKGFVRSIQTEIQSLLARNASSLKELSVRTAFLDRDYPAIRDLISQELRNESLHGHVVCWSTDETHWHPGWQPRPPASTTLIVPPEWRKWRPDLQEAEEIEFRLKKYSDALLRYKDIFNRAQDRHIKAWMLNRMARCSVKQMSLTQAMKSYRALISDFPGLLTESGRPIELVSRLELLSALRSAREFEDFFQESLLTYTMLNENNWSLDGDQVNLYAIMLKDMIEAVTSEDTSIDIPEGYAAAVVSVQNSIDKRIEIWRMAEAVGQMIPSNGEKENEDLASDHMVVRKNAFEVNNSEILVFSVPLSRKISAHYANYLGLVLQFGDLERAIEASLTENRPPNASVLIRSVLSDRIVFGEKVDGRGRLVVTVFFPESFPPWRVELYQGDAVGSGFFLYKNIFFWTILALLFTLFLGSGLIIRTIVNEVSLLNLKSEFIASVSHEFKTPLTSMGADLERLMDGEVKDPHKIQEYYRILRHDTDRVKRLVKNVLDFTKIEEGKREYKPAPTDIVSWIRQEVDSFEKENRMAGFKVDIKIGDDIPSIYADEEAISQALHNILDNAAKFSDQEKKIDVEVNRNQDIVEIAVRDRGIGIPESEQKKIFEKFYRGKQASSVSPTGTGLGLTLVKHIMDAHGGDVIVQSRSSEGSRVSLIFPCHEGV
jgi:signal transduction histidine kinase